jgi:hypothetical protein
MGVIFSLKGMAKPFFVYGGKRCLFEDGIEIVPVEEMLTNLPQFFVNRTQICF